MADKEVRVLQRKQVLAWMAGFLVSGLVVGGMPANAQLLPGGVPTVTVPTVSTPTVTTPTVTTPRVTTPTVTTPSPSPAPRLPSTPRVTTPKAPSAPSVRVPSVSLPSLGGSGGGSSGSTTAGTGLLSPILGGGGQVIGTGSGRSTLTTAGTTLGGALGGGLGGTLSPLTGGPSGAGALPAIGGAGGSNAIASGPLPPSATLSEYSGLAPLLLGGSASGNGALTAGETFLALRQALASSSACVGALAPLEQDALVLRFGLNGGTPLSRRATGRVLGLSRQRVGTVERRALRNVRNISATGGCTGASAGGAYVLDPTSIGLVPALGLGTTATGTGGGRSASGAGAPPPAVPQFASSSAGDPWATVLAIAVAGALLLACGLLLRRREEEYAPAAPQRSPAPIGPPLPSREAMPVAAGANGSGNGSSANGSSANGAHNGSRNGGSRRFTRDGEPAHEPVPANGRSSNGAPPARRREPAAH